jgi:hypothetical protein
MFSDLRIQFSLHLPISIGPTSRPVFCDPSAGQLTACIAKQIS